MHSKQQKVMINLMEQQAKNNGKSSLSKAMREAGYSPTYAKNPHLFKSTKKWSNLISNTIPEAMAVEQLKKLILAPIRRRQYVKGEIIWETEELDGNAIAKGLDLYFKITGKYHQNEEKVIDQLDLLSDEELDNEIRRLEIKYNNKIIQK
jgi:hypothetical protein